MKKNLRTLTLASLLSVISLGTSATQAQAQADSAFKPTTTVKLVVPFPPGGGTDALGRILGEKLTSLWHQQVIVENRSGAQGNIGTAYAAKAPADGYTLLLAHQGVMTVNPHLYKDTGFDTFRDFIPVSQGTQQPFVLVANPSVPVTTLKDVEAMARSRPGTLSYGSSAAGPQLAVEMFKYATGTDLLHVAYKGAGPAVVDVLAGNIDLMVANPSSVAQHVKAGKLRALVLFGSQPVEVLPGTPTAVEAGYPTLGDKPEWYGIAVPAGTPATVVSQLTQDINTALSDPGVQQRLKALGLNASPGTQSAFADQIRRDYDYWGALIPKAGIRAD